MGIVRVALVSDTHDRVDPALERLFRGATWLIHAGDVTRDETLAALCALVPGARLLAVRGNNDRRGEVAKLPEQIVEEVAGVRMRVVHDRADARPADEEVVVVGHSHRARTEVIEGRLWINPGSAGPKRFNLLRSAALLGIGARELVVRVHSLEDAALPVVLETRAKRAR